MSKIMMSDELLNRLQQGTDSPSVLISGLKGKLELVSLGAQTKKLEFTTTNVPLALDLLNKKFPMSVIIKYEDASLGFDFTDASISIEFAHDNVKVLLEETNEE